MADIHCDATNGNDSTGDGSAGNPYQTLQKCVDVAAGGDTIWIGDTSAQVLAAAITWNTGWSGGTNDSTFLVIRGWDYSGGAGVSATAVIDGNNAVSTWDSSTSRPAYVAMLDLEIHSTTSHGVSCSTTWLIRDCYVHDTGGRGISMAGDCLALSCRVEETGSYGVYMLNDCVVRHCRIEGWTSAGVYIANRLSVVDSCIIVGEAGLSAFDYAVLAVADLSQIVNCTLAGVSQSGRGLGVNSSFQDRVTAINNLITGWSVGLADNGGHFLQKGYNQFYDNSTDETLTGGLSVDLGNNSTANPDYVGGGDYTPQAFVAGSPGTIGGTDWQTVIGAVQRSGGGGAAVLFNRGLLSGGRL